MNQIAHIFRKDCRRLWRTMAAVLLFTTLHGYGEVAQPVSGYVIGLSPRAALLILAGLSYILLPVLLFLLVVSVIQEESLVGSNEFWLTRPYDRRNLFFEKLLFVAMWVVLPMLLHDVLLIRHFGFSLSSAAGLLLWKTFQFLVFLLIAAALAVLSATFARAVLLAIGAVLVALLTLFIALQSSAIPGDPGNTSYLTLAVLALAAVGALCVVAFQYRFRIASVAASIGGVAILACALLVRFWPSSLTAYLSHRNDFPLLQTVQLLPDANLKNLPQPRPAHDAGDQARTVYYPVHAAGVSDFAVDLVGIAGQFESPGQKPTSFYPSAEVRFQPLGDNGQFADAGGPDQLVPFTPNFAGDYERVKNADGVMSGKLFLEGFRTVVARVSVPSSGNWQDLAVAGRHCKVGSYPREHNLVLIFDCVELEPGNTSHFQVRLLQNNLGITPSQTRGDSSSAGSWPAFLSPILRTNFTCEFDLRGSAENSSGESSVGREMLVSVEQSMGKQERPFRIDHFRPAELTLQAWEQRGVLRAETTNAQSKDSSSAQSR
ncbi:MAG TPA: hypothetical protein VMU05_15280 [Dongiaceae bacterium]|nr:hypothetical protein [Dongiaceae bacterium]